MPTIDDSRGVLVVRIVYDGPAMSGKTTSLRALAHGFGTTLESPEERDGRTLYFDWMDYVGGLFEGRPIRCQVVTVPGQTQLAERRARLLETADAVVVVVDSRKGELSFGMGWVREAAQSLRNEEPPVGLVVQANKRDAEDATPREEIRAELTRIASIALVESVATNADGTREAFVLAVRLALDRVRALASAGKLPNGPPADNDAGDLLKRLRGAERAPRQEEKGELSAPSAMGAEVEGPHSPVAHLRNRPSEPRLRVVSHDEVVFEPDPMMPGGMIWPPVEGRTLLHEISMLDMRPTRTQRGDWWGSGSGWRMHSEREAIFADPDSARQELIEWARLHASVNKRVSGGRVVILADAGTGRLRLWQLVRVESALRERLASAMAQAEAEAVAQGLADVANRLIAARAWFREGNLNLPCTLWTIGDQPGYRPVYVGLMPRAPNLTASEPHALPLVAREMLPHLRELRRIRVDFPDVEARLRRLGSDGPDDAPAALLSALTRSL